MRVNDDLTTHRHSQGWRPWLLTLLLAAFAAPALASEPVHQGTGPWSLTALAGKEDDARFADILTAQESDVGSSKIAGVVVGYRLDQDRFDLIWTNDALTWELEGQLYRHRGAQDHWEANAALVVHWNRFPWDATVPTTVSFGQGLSLASERPAIEEDTRRLLHYMHAEVTVRGNNWEHLSVVARLHHRSGAFGLYGTSGGSNFITAGLRYRF